MSGNDIRCIGEHPHLCNKITGNRKTGNRTKSNKNGRVRRGYTKLLATLSSASAPFRSEAAVSTEFATVYAARAEISLNAVAFLFAAYFCLCLLHASLHNDRGCTKQIATVELEDICSGAVVHLRSDSGTDAATGAAPAGTHPSNQRSVHCFSGWEFVILVWWQRQQRPRD